MKEGPAIFRGRRNRLAGRMGDIGAVLGALMFAAVVLGAPPPAVGAMRPLAERQPLIVGASGDGFPYSFFNERGEPDGFAAEVLAATTRAMRLRISRVSHPGTALFARFREGEFDLLQLYSQTPEREAHAEFSVPILTLQGAVFVRRGGPVRSLADLKDGEFAIVGVGSIGERFLRDRGLTPRIRQVASTSDALRLVETGECAGTFVTQLTALAIAKKTGLRQVVMLGEPVEGYDVRHCFAVHRGDAELLARLNEGLAILHATGEFDRLYRKWFGPVVGVTFTREQVAIYVAGALAVAFAVALWGVLRQRALRRRIEELNAGLAAGIAARTAELAARVGEVERLYAEQQTLLNDLQSSRAAADRAAAGLQELNGRLMVANQELEAFAYSVSHDLRAPLRNITGFLELLGHRTAGRLDGESARFVAVTTKEATRLGRLIDELLAFSRLGRSELTMERIALGELTAEVREELRPEIGERPVEWRIGELPVVAGDRALLRQVLVNLLGNAVKFTRGREPAMIEVGVQPAADEGGLIAFFVRDNGAGYNAKYQDKLFGVFQRLHNVRDFEGTGIGLAIVKRIVVRHGGRVWAEGAVERGATFYFSLPGHQS